MSEIQQTIGQLIKDHRVILFMKGSADFPQCGFSFHVVQILKNHQIEFHAINVLEDQEMRAGIKQFSDWPTIPQLYINGEFVGGCDIVQSLDASGELAALLGAVE